MQILKLTKDDAEYYIDIHHEPVTTSMKIVRAMMKLDAGSFELVEMSKKEYQSIAATNESAKLFGPFTHD